MYSARNTQINFQNNIQRSQYDFSIKTKNGQTNLHYINISNYIILSKNCSNYQKIVTKSAAKVQVKYLQIISY